MVFSNDFKVRDYSTSVPYVSVRRCAISIAGHAITFTFKQKSILNKYDPKIEIVNTSYSI